MFGSTLEITSHLNEIGQPMKIHISSETKQLLDSIGGFRMEYRGVSEIKVIRLGKSGFKPKSNFKNIFFDSLRII